MAFHGISTEKSVKAMDCLFLVLAFGGLLGIADVQGSLLRRGIQSLATENRF
jgi:hypothetical protein